MHFELLLILVLVLHENFMKPYFTITFLRRKYKIHIVWTCRYDKWPPVINDSCHNWHYHSLTYSLFCVLDTRAASAAAVQRQWEEAAAAASRRQRATAAAAAADCARWGGRTKRPWCRARRAVAGPVEWAWARRSQVESRLSTAEMRPHPTSPSYQGNWHR